jgi:hypothetical protein
MLALAYDLGVNEAAKSACFIQITTMRHEFGSRIVATGSSSGR